MYGLKSCCDLLKSRALQNNDDVMLKWADGFKSVLDLSWNYDLGKKARRTLHLQRRNQSVALPLTEDVQALSGFLHDNITQAMDSLVTYQNPADYEKLQRSLLCLIISFNRKRAGEAARMRTSDLEHSTSHDLTELGLTKLEMALAKKLQRVEIGGKRDRHVPILLTEFMQQGIDTLVSKRKTFIESPTNPYLFANKQGEGHVDGFKWLKAFSQQCGAKHPERLRSTNMRKHFATQIQLFNLNENELDVVASFMGHDLIVHRSYYRKPHQLLQMTYLSMLFMALDSGQLTNLAGRSLEKIDASIIDMEIEGLLL